MKDCTTVIKLAVLLLFLCLLPTACDLAGLETCDIGGRDERIHDLAWSPAGKRLVYSGFDGGVDLDIWVYDFTTHRNTNLTADFPDRQADPVWSPDGSKIAFANGTLANYYTKTDLWMMNADGTHPVSLTTDSNALLTPAAFSPDGQYLMGYSRANREAPSNAWVLPLDGSGLVHLPLLGNGELSNPVFSSDGRQLAYTSVSADGATHQLWQMPIENGVPGNATLVWTGTQRLGAYSWSPDNRELIFTFSVEGARLHRLDIASGRESRIETGLSDSQRSATWSPAGSHIAFMTGKPLYTPLTLYIMDADGSYVRKIKLTDDAEYIDESAYIFFELVWSPDGQSLAMVGSQGPHHYVIFWVKDIRSPEAINLFRQGCHH